jgi:hypothetical protein
MAKERALVGTLKVALAVLDPHREALRSEQLKTCGVKHQAPYGTKQS